MEPDGSPGSPAMVRASRICLGLPLASAHTSVLRAGVGSALDGWRNVDPCQQSSDATLELVGGALERGIGLRVAGSLAGRGGDAPVRVVGVLWELGADLAYAVAQCDHVIEALVEELVEVL